MITLAQRDGGQLCVLEILVWKLIQAAGGGQRDSYWLSNTGLQDWLNIPHTVGYAFLKVFV